MCVCNVAEADPLTPSFWWGEVESLPRSAPGSSRGVLGRIIFGGQAMTPADCGHVLGTAISGARPFLMRRCSNNVWWSPVGHYDEGTMPAEEHGLCRFVLWLQTDVWSDQSWGRMHNTCLLYTSPSPRD